jgi:diketogulonate reductase-like aldo/keto reductase
MKIIKAIQCAGVWRGKRCTEKINVIKCSNSLVNGCDNYYCLILHWPEHAKEHELEWQQMSEVDKNKLIAKYGG